MVKKVSLIPEPSARIVSVAERIFLKSGFHRVLMDDLARELGMSKKTLYAHFESKESLLRAVLQRRTALIDAELKAIVESAVPFPKKFRDLTRLIQTRTGEVSPAFIEDIRRYAPQCFEIVEKFRGQAIPLYFGKLVQEGARSGYLRSDIDAQVLVRMLVLSIQGIVRPEVIGELRLHPSEALEHILSIILHGIVTPKGRKSSS